MVLTASEFFDRDPIKVTPEVEADFFSSIKLSNQTFKRTDVGRFEALNRELIGMLVESGAAINLVLDVAVSSGTTTLELLRDLQAAGFSPAVTATDLALDAHIVPLFPGCRALVDKEGYPLQYELLGVAVRPWRRRLDLVSGAALVRTLLNRACGPRARAALRRGADVRPVRLISPRLASHPDVEVTYDDILVHNPALACRYDLVRAANILNRHYFTEAQLRRAAAHLRGYLAGPGALLFVVRTLEGGSHHGTLFELAPDRRLRAKKRFGRGSEIEALLAEAGPDGS